MYRNTIIIILAALLKISHMEYIPPGPTYPCPKETDKHLLFPCVCENGTDSGLFVRCENVGLAAASVGIGNIAGLGLPIEKLTLKNFKVSHLYGPIFHRSVIRVLNIEAPIKNIDEYTFAGVNRTLKELYISGTELEEFPKEAFRILGNLSILALDGHKITSLGKDIFVGSEAAGKLERLMITNGDLSEFTPETFQYLKKLRTLDLHGNKLSNLKKNQFKGLRDLEVLDLSYNNITKLDGSHIGDLTKLGWCNVSHNQIGDIPRGMFARNTVIKVVHLDNNKLKKLDTNSFRGMRFLRRLYLQDNAIAEVGRGTFAAVTRIGTVNLARNKITKVDFQMFQQVKYAELIDLSENNITIIEKQAFTDLYLAVVNISHNALSVIEPGAFENCNNMTLLDLSHNKLEEIHKMAFDVNSYAFELQVSYNLFTDLLQIPIGNMSGLHILNASHNAIERVPRNSIPKLFELNTVDLSYNNLTEIFNAIFQNLFSLRYLNLSHNSLSQIKPGTFGTLSTVLEVDLSHNKLADVSKGSLAKLASCRVLDVSYNMMDRIFQIPISLGELNFAHNRLTEIPPNTWPSMNALLRLNLSSNRLTDSLQSVSFVSLLTLQQLDLSSNGVSQVPWEALNALSSLQYLYLQNNSLTSLSRTAFGNLPTLFELDLSHNSLASVAPMSFGGLQQLQTLSLRGNELETIHNEAFKGLVALTKLDLSYNMIEKINNKTHGLLDECLSIETVILSHNKFSAITKKTFPSNQYIPYKLYDVDLSYNKLPVLTHDATFGTKKLKRFNVSNNYLFEIRNTVLGNMTSLEILDLSNNNLKNLNSFNSDATVKLPQTIRKIFLQNNKMDILPLQEIVNKTQLTLLDIRNNQLTSFSPDFVKKIRKDDFNVYFEGNPLKCDCQIRPLKHYLNKKSLEQIQRQQIYTNLTCSQPSAIENENLLTIDEERLVCMSNDVIQNGRGAVDDFDFVSEPDVVIRDLQCSQTSILVHWYILSIEDIADFYIIIRNQNNTVLYSNNVGYNLRSLSIAIDKDFKMALENGGRFEICILPKNSNGSTRKWFQRQCMFLPDDFSSWPKKVSNDKRRLNKKRTYSWFSSSALGMISDSILITLCIFLGVCFRRMAELEHF